MSEAVSSTVCEGVGEVNEGVTTSPEIITIDDGDDDDSQTREIQDLWRDKRQLTEENRQQKQKIITLEADLDGKNDEIRALRNQVKSNKEFHEKALQKKIDEGKLSAAEINKLKNQNQDMDLQVAKLKKEAEELQVRLTATTTKCDEEKKLAEKTTDDLANATKEISTRKQEVDSQKQEIGAQKQEIAKLKKEIEKCGEDAKNGEALQQQKIAEIEKSLQTSEDNGRKLQKVVSEQETRIGELEAGLQKSRDDDQVLFQDSTKIMELYKQVFQQLDVNDDDDDAQNENEPAVGEGHELQNRDDSINKGPQLPENAEQVSAPVTFSNTHNDQPGTSYSPVCLFCKKSFGDENALRIHLSLKHNQNRSKPGPNWK